MHPIATVLNLFKPFCFISDIQIIHDDLASLENEAQAINLRRKLLALKAKSYYEQLNVYEFEKAIYQGLIYLAHKFPLNNEDPISLNELKENDSVCISTGHRFELDSFATYLKKQSIFQLKNPVSNLAMSKQDTLRIIAAVEKKHPENFKSLEAQNNKALLNRFQKFNCLVAKFQHKSEEEQIQILEYDFYVKLSVLPMIDIAIFHFIMLNYYNLIKEKSIQTISSYDARGLVLTNILSLGLTHFIFENFYHPDILASANFSFRIKKTLSSIAYLIMMDLLFPVVSNLNLVEGEFEQQLNLFQASLFANAFYIICLQIKYPIRDYNLSHLLAIASLLLGFYCSSHLIKSVYSETFDLFEEKTEKNKLFIADHLLYMPFSILLYTYISEIKKTCSQLSKYIKQTEGQFEMNMDMDDETFRYMSFH